MRLCVLHNLYFYNTMMEEIRDAIEKGALSVVQRRKIIWDGTAYVRHQQGRSVKSLRIMGKKVLHEKGFFRYNRESEYRDLGGTKLCIF